MFCIIAFVILSILGIFSATHRALAKEALDCVLRRVTFRPCTTGFDEKMKAKILGAVIMRSEKLAGFISKYFEALAWFFFILLLSATIFTFRGLFLFYTTGSCNGLNQEAFCVFDPTGANNQVSTTTQGCKVKPPTLADLTLKGVDLTGFPVLNPTAKEKIVFIGCYACDYTRKAYPMITKLADRFNVGMVFLHYPVKEKTDHTSQVGYCAYQQNQDKFWKLNDVLFSTAKTNLESDAFIQTTLTNLGYDAAKINVCVNDPATEVTVRKQMAEIQKTNFFGTPTIFIKDHVFVGPKPFRVYAIGLEGLLYFLH